MNQSQVPSQSTNQSVGQIKYKGCLLVTRHRLLELQQNDLNKICEKITRIETLPNDLNELKKVADFYDAIIGIVPLPIQVQLLQLRKDVLLFYMESLGTAKTKEEAQQLLVKSGHEGVILPPAREGEPYRVSVYHGIVRIKEIKIIDEHIIQH